MSTTPTKRIESANLNLKEQVVSINRVTKVVKGGKNMSFSALVVVGDPGARVVGFGTGNAKDVPAIWAPHARESTARIIAALRALRIPVESLVGTVRGVAGSPLARQ